MITAEQVKELREKTGAGLMDCKKALSESQGNLEVAVDFLRRQGVLKAAKKSSRQTNEGLLMEACVSEGTAAALVEVSCETDFVARTDDFQALLKNIAKTVLQNQPQSPEALNECRLGWSTVAEAVSATIAKLGENMAIRRFEFVQAGAGERVGVYVHPGNKVGALVQMRGNKVTPELVKDIAMHITAMHPLYLSDKTVPAEAREREMENLKSSPDLAGKAAPMLDKILEGKYRKYLQEVCLMDQIFFREMSGKSSVRDHLKKLDPSLEVTRFVRYQMGEAL